MAIRRPEVVKEGMGSGWGGGGGGVAAHHCDVVNVGIRVLSAKAWVYGQRSSGLNCYQRG